LKVPIHKLKSVKVTAARSVSFSVLIRKAKASRPMRFVREVFALLSLLRLRRETYAWQKYRDTSVYRSAKSVRELTPGKVARAGFSFGMKASAMATIAVLILVPGIQAFEAHIVNITAEHAMIDPPFLTPPGNNDHTDTNGGGPYTDPIDVFFDNEDPDGTHIYFTYGAGNVPAFVPDPVCGQTGPNGGGDAEIPIELVPLNLTSTTVVKAITCDGDGSVLPVHKSLVNTKIYPFEDGIELLCEPFDVVFPINLAVQAAGPGNSAFGDIISSANLIVNGDVLSNDSITAEGGGANRDIFGNATSSTNIAVANYNITGSIATGTPTTTLPDINIPLWQGLADDGGVVNGSLIFPDNTPGIELGPTEIMGDLYFGSTNSVTINGPIYVHGDVTIENNTSITQNAAFGDNFTTIIADGNIFLESNVTFNGAGTIGTFLLVSTAGPQSGADAAIELSQNGSVIGDVVLYASNGDVHVRQNWTLLAVFGTLGTAAGAPAIDFDSNVEVTWRELPTAISCGPVFTPIESLLINEFVPNPAGSDQGAAGAPLNGEWVELFNNTGAPVDVTGWVLYDEVDTHQLSISATNTAGSLIIAAGDFLVVYRDGDTDFELNNNDDTVRLYDGEIGAGGILKDSRLYNYGEGIPDDKSFARIPDGTANWVDPEPTPGEPNTAFFVPLGVEPTDNEELITDDSESDLSSDSSPSPGEEEDLTPTLSPSADEAGSSGEGETDGTASSTPDEIVPDEEQSDDTASSTTEEIVGEVETGDEEGNTDLSLDSSPSSGEEEQAPQDNPSPTLPSPGEREEQEAILNQVQSKPEDEPADDPDGDTPPPSDPEPTVSEGLFGETLSTNSVDSVLPPASE